MSGYDEAGVVRRMVRQAVTSQPVARLLPALDRGLFRATRGRLLFSAWIGGLPVVSLTTVGARTGQPRATRVLGIPEGDGLIVVGVNFGRPTNPSWYYNIRANPRVLVVDQGIERGYEARELLGEERDQGFDRVLAINPGWRHLLRAVARPIPVIRLNPAQPPQTERPEARLLAGTSARTQTDPTGDLVERAVRGLLDRKPPSGADRHRDREGG